VQSPFVIAIAIAIEPAAIFHEHRQHNTYLLTVRHYRRMNPSP